MLPTRKYEIWVMDRFLFTFIFLTGGSALYSIIQNYNSFYVWFLPGFVFVFGLGIYKKMPLKVFNWTVLIAFIFFILQFFDFLPYQRLVEIAVMGLIASYYLGRVVAIYLPKLFKT